MIPFSTLTPAHLCQLSRWKNYVWGNFKNPWRTTSPTGKKVQTFSDSISSSSTLIPVFQCTFDAGSFKYIFCLIIHCVCVCCRLLFPPAQSPAFLLQQTAARSSGTNKVRSNRCSASPSSVTWPLQSRCWIYESVIVCDDRFWCWKRVKSPNRLQRDTKDEETF